jgi:integrase
LYVKAEIVDPIKTVADINALRAYLRDTYPAHGREYELFVTLGVNLGLRAGDILKLEYGALQGSHVCVCEEKTKKPRLIFINGKVRAAMEAFKQPYELTYTKTAVKVTSLYIADSYNIFTSQKGGCIEVKAMHRIIKEASRALGWSGNFGTHSLRKTFAYHAYELTRDLKTVQRLMNHSKIAVTKLYVGIDRDYSNDADYPGTDDEIYSLNCL